MTSRIFTESERSKIDKYATKLRVLDGIISVLFESHDVPSFSSGPAKVFSSSSLHTGWYAGDPAILGWFSSENGHGAPNQCSFARQRSCRLRSKCPSDQSYRRTSRLLPGENNVQLSVSEGRVVNEAQSHSASWTVTSPSRRSPGRCTIEEGRKHLQTMIVIPKLPGGWNSRGYQGIEGVTCSA